MNLTGLSTGLVADSGERAVPSPPPSMLTALAGTSIAHHHPYTASTPTLSSPSIGNNGQHPLHPQQLQQRQSYQRSPSSSPPGAEAEGGGPIPVIEFPDDEVFYPDLFFHLFFFVFVFVFFFVIEQKKASKERSFFVLALFIHQTESSYPSNVRTDIHQLDKHGLS